MEKKQWTQEQVNEMVRLHGMWLRGEEGGKQACVEHGDFSDLDLSGVDLDGAVLHDCTFTKTNMDKAVLWEADLSDSEFFETTMRYAVVARSKFSNALIYGVDATGAVFKSVRIDGSRLRDSIFAKSDFSNADMRGASVINCKFLNANLGRANLELTTVDGGEFENANFMYATFSESGMEAWKSAGAQLDSTNIERSMDLNAIADALSPAKRALLQDYIEQLKWYEE